MSGRRRLTDEEHALWKGVTRSVAELRRRRRTKAEPPKAQDDNPPGREAPKPVRPAKLKIPAVVPAPPAPPPPVAALERRLKQRIVRGTQAIDDRIDLHGMTQAQAHAALARFLRMAQAKGARIVLVITGKGGAPRGDFGEERGVLKRQVPLWLRQAEFRVAVIGFETAGVAHGGEGALYVRLRKARRE
jgi:DNA-nicking Smr family endonuclease